MTILEYTRRRIAHLLEKTRALRAGEFAQHDSAEALKEIQAWFEHHEQQLEILSSPGTDPDVVANHCSLVIGELFKALPILGFLHRSKSASNAFELYAPLKSLARQVIGEDTKLILSSEWNYSPHTYIRMLHFPHYVLVGMPASEGSNGLLAPLAGHEFGHSVWDATGAFQALKPTILASTIAQIRSRFTSEWVKYFPDLTVEADLDTKVAYTEAWAPAFSWALSQAEEGFCDFVGLLLFDTAYLHAFTYLLAPGIPGARSARYPSLPQRRTYLAEAANEFGINIPPGFATAFRDIPVGKSRTDFLISIADDVLSGILGLLRQKANDYLLSKHIPRVDFTVVNTIVDQFKLLAPANNPVSLSAIMNAGWIVAHEETVWQEFPKVSERRYEVLNDLVVKSAEVLEYNQRTRKTT
jgi:hypothetical protein